MPSPLRARLRNAVLGKTDAKIARQQRQLDAQAKELETARTQQTKRVDALAARTDKALAAEARRAKAHSTLQKLMGELGELRTRE